MIEQLRNLHTGKACYIIGTGPSLQYLRKKHFGPGVIIALNQSIEVVEALGLPNPVYSMQKDGCGDSSHGNGPCTGPFADHMKRPKSATLLVHRRESLSCFSNYYQRVIFDNELDFHQPWNMNSAIIAIDLAMAMGCKNLIFVGFDYITSGATGRMYDDKQDLYTYQTQAARQKEYLSHLVIPFMYIEPVPEYPTISELGCKHPGETCYIVGRGPSLKDLKAEDFGPGPVIAINEAIIEVSKLGISNPVYVLWRNGGEGDYFRNVKKAITQMKMQATVLLCDDPVIGGEYEWPPSSAMFDYLRPRQHVFDCHRDFGYPPASCFSHFSAYWLAGRMGCRAVVSMCFDSYRGITDVATPDGVKPEKYDCYSIQAEIMKNLTAGTNHIWYFPKEKQPTVTVITCTGDRPEAFDLCKKWMNNQTRQPDEWIIVDDGKKFGHIFLRERTRYLYRQPQPTDPEHTLGLNLALALDRAKGDIIIFMEDDDYYAPGYIEKMVSMFFDNSYPDPMIVGHTPAAYYHLPTRRWCVHNNFAHASLGQTAIRREAIPALKDCLTTSPIDMTLWFRYPGKKLLFGTVDGLFVGIKGLPGRPGISSGHTGSEDYYTNQDTPDCAKLREWIPEDYKYYSDYLPLYRYEGKGVFTRHSIIDCSLIPRKKKITLAIPTRHQPERMKRLLQNIVDTTNHPEDLEIILGVDMDDPGSHQYDHERLHITNLVFKPGIGCGTMQNGMFQESTGDIYFTINDDCIIRTKGWDDEIIKIYDSFPDEIVFVVVNDLTFKGKLAVFPCQSRKAINIIGGIADPRYMKYRYDDHVHHVYDILRQLGHDRIVYREDLVFEHDHYRLANGERIYAKAGEIMESNDGDLYAELLAKRKYAALRLSIKCGPPWVSIYEYGAITETTNFYNGG